MPGADNVVYLGVNAVSREHRDLLRRVQTRLSEQVRQCLDGTLEQADDALFDRAERAVSDDLQQSHFAAMRQIRLHRKAIVARFGEELDAAFRRLALGETGPRGDEGRARGDSAWQLMDNAEVEKEVAVDTTVRRVRGRTALALTQIEERLRSMADGELHEGANPFEPRVVVDAFSAAMDTVAIDIQPRVILYKLFEKQLLARLPEVYDAANREFAAAGVLPDLKPVGAPRPAGGERGAAGAALAGQGATGETGHRDPATGFAPPGGPPDNEVVNLLHQLIAEAKRESRDPGTDAPATEAAGDEAPFTADAAALVGVLSALQRKAAASSGTPLGADRLKTVIARGVTRGAGEAKLEQTADDTIDIVSMLFDVILEDSRLPDPVKALFARLQIPVLKVALLDREFFGSRSHPARRLINSLSRAAAAWEPEANLQSDPLFQAMQSVIEKVVDDFTDDAGVFEAALREFEARREERDARAQVVEERTRQAEAGKARVEEARERVRREVEARVSGDPAPPEVVVRLLEDAWFKVLFITAVKEGVDSDAWRENIAVMDRLLASVRGRGSEADRRQLLSNMPGLLQDLREGLNGIMFNPLEMTRLFRELEAEHLRLVKEPRWDDAEPARNRREAGSPPAAPAEGGREAPAADADDPSVAREATVEAAVDLGEPAIEAAADVPVDPEIAAELRSTALGTWFEFVDGDGHRTRGKLSARLSDGARYVFVNRAGFKVADRDFDELVAAVADGRAAPVDDNALFDRALENVITNLREMRAGRAH